MSYQVLSRKYRPQVFDSIAGQSHVTRTLQNAIRLDRVAHGYLFTGPRGIGKTTVARILAKSLNCKEFHNDEPCDQCVNCVEITEGRSMDVQEIDGASNRGIDEIRDLREAVRYSPSSGKYRIYIIDEVHMLTNPAFNALLKTLEEPPPHVVFIMATTDPHKIPQTILSRTQRFDFKRMRQDEIVDHLGGILQKENIQHSDGSLELIAAKADGSMRDSLSLLDQVIAYSGDSIEENIVRDVLGIIKESFFLELLQEIHLSNSSALLDHLHHLIESGFSISDFISGFNGFLRNCLLVLSGKKNKTQTTDEVLDWLEQNQTTLSAVDLLRMLEMTLQFESRLRFIQQPRIALESLFLKLAAMDSSVTITQLLKNPGKLPAGIPKPSVSGNKLPSAAATRAQPVKPEKKTETKPAVNPAAETRAASDSPVVPAEVPAPSERPASTDVPVSAKVPAPSDVPAPSNLPDPSDVPAASYPDSARPAPPDLTLESISAKWPDIMDKLEGINFKICHFLDNAELVEYAGKRLIIQLQNENGFEVKSLEKDKAQIEKLLQDETGSVIRIKFRFDENRANKKQTEPKQPEKDHPLTMDVLETFNGEIIR